MKRNVAVTCEQCENCIYIGEGDFICNKKEEPMLVIEDWIPTVFPIECGLYEVRK